MPTMDRRAFLKLSAAMGASLAWSGAIAKLLVEVANDPDFTRVIAKSRV